MARFLLHSFFFSPFAFVFAANRKALANATTTMASSISSPRIPLSLSLSLSFEAEYKAGYSQPVSFLVVIYLLFKWAQYHPPTAV